MLENILAHLPHPAEKRIAIRVRPQALAALRAGHPWLFDQAIEQVSHAGAPGDLAVIFDTKRRFVAIGLYDPDSPIRVKILQHSQPVQIDADFWRGRLRAAVQRRAPLQAQGTTGYRLVHGENDGLPGLIIDRYAETLVLKLYTAAWLPHLRDLLPALEEVQPSDRWVLRLSRALQGVAGLQDGMLLRGESDFTGEVDFLENGLRFAADVRHGHKTGFFFDHRENRARVGGYAQGARVLDVFAYAGGFSLYAARGGARSVLSLDQSAPALEAAQRNFKLNREHPAVVACQHETLAADAFMALEDLAAQGRRFDLIVIDPPSFAKRAAEVPGALAAYARLTRLGLALLERDGLLVLASCSSRVSSQDFFAQVHAAARDAGRPLREIERSGHALDHPIGFPEGEYLKCLFARA